MAEVYRNALPQGTILDTYQIDRTLGVGGFGITYLVSDLALGKAYAIKELLPDGIAVRLGGETTVMARSTSAQEDFDATRKYFLAEARVLAGMNHPAVVSVYRLFEANGTCYIVMDYIEGDTLGNHLNKQGGKINGSDEFQQIFPPLMSGLELLHTQGIIHRDIKPGNIMIQPSGEPVLLDFGAATLVQSKTMTITQMLTAGYSPFEQYTSKAHQGPYTDIYALGATMYKCITGEKPDDASDRVQNDAYQLMAENTEYLPAYGKRILAAVDAALRMDSKLRPQSIAELREMMKTQISNEVVTSEDRTKKNPKPGHPPKHSDALLIAWRLAEFEAINVRSTELEPVHFFLGLLKVSELDLESILADNTSRSSDQIRREIESAQQMSDCLSQVGIETTQTRRRLRRSLPIGSGEIEKGQHVRRGMATRDVFRGADELAIKYQSDTVQPLHLLSAIAESNCPWVASALDRSGLTGNDLSDEARAILDGKPKNGAASNRSQAQTKRPPSKNPGKGHNAPGFAERIGRDLTELARQNQLSPVIGRKPEMLSLIQALLRSRKNNAIIIGEAGVGKTGVVEGLAQRIADGQVPSEFSGKRIIEISMGSLVAGTNLRGDMEERLQSLISESKRNPDLILFIDEIHLLVGAGQGSGSAMDAANLLKPALARGEIRVIGATTTHEFRRFIEVDPALTRRFEVVEVSEPNRPDTIAILQGLRPSIEEHHGVKIHDEALDAAIDLTVRYLPSRRLPDKAIDVLDQACAQVRMRSLSGDFKAQVMAGISIMRKDVAEAVAHRCKVPVDDLNDDDSERLINLEVDLEKRIKGQSNAIKAVAETIRLARSGLKKPGTPIGSFLFAGPSGTGKTELSKALAECLFGDENQLIRIDMSEFMEAHSVSKLIGAPPGFIGHEERGQLTESVRSNPYSVVLLDEVEKAHPKILDLFLQVFDNGSLTDAHGTKIDFRETIIIMTSNLGAGTVNRPLGFGDGSQGTNAEDELRESVRSAAKKFFRPEFLNRLSEVIVFKQLEKKVVRQIVEMLVARLNGRLQNKGVSVELTPSATDFIINSGYSSTAGARELEKTIEREISTPLSKLILKGIPDSTVKVFYIDHKKDTEVLTIK